MRKKDFLQTPAPSHAPPNGQRQTEPMGGDVMLFDANSMQELKVIPAHQAALSCLAMNKEGTLLATASEKGTIIRIFELPSARKLYQFRRGSMAAKIHCMSFNATSTLLCVSSATETVHIFKLSPSEDRFPARGPNGQVSNPPSPRADGRDRSVSPSSSLDPSSTSALDAPSRQNAGFMSMVRRTSQNVGGGLVARAANYLPAAVTEIWEPTRDFAWVKVPKAKNGHPVQSVVAMAGGSPQVMVATSEGDFLVYNIDLESGGEGTLVRQYSYATASPDVE